NAALAPVIEAIGSLTLPVGVGADGAVTYLDLAGTGSAALVAPAGEVRRVLHDWLVSLTTLFPADQLALWADATSSELLSEDAASPHFGRVDGRSAATDDVLDELLDLVEARGDDSAAPAPVVALVDLGSAGRSALVERLLAGGP